MVYISFYLIKNRSVGQFGFNGTFQQDLRGGAFQQDLGGTLILFVGAGAATKVYLKGTFDRNLTLNQWMAHKK